jgi:hypothetical protein
MLQGQLFTELPTVTSPTVTRMPGHVTASPRPIARQPAARACTHAVSAAAASARPDWTVAWPPHLDLSPSTSQRKQRTAGAWSSIRHFLWLLRAPFRYSTERRWCGAARPAPLHACVASVPTIHTLRRRPRANDSTTTTTEYYCCSRRSVCLHHRTPSTGFSYVNRFTRAKVYSTYGIPVQCTRPRHVRVRLL